MLTIDALTLSTREITPEGYLRARASITCVGIQEYSGLELRQLVDSGVSLDDNKVYRVFRPASTVFADETQRTLKLKPITDNHPHTFVDSDNYKGFSIGSTGDSVSAIDDNRLGVSVVFTNTEAVKKIEAGTHQLSAGYNGHVSMQQGNYQGISYDAIWDSPMLINHIALVSTDGGGRCGNGARILDHKTKEVTTMANAKSNKAEDMDMGMILSQVAEKMMPQIQELLQSDDFQTKLADTLANNLSDSMQGGGDVDNGDADFVEASDVDAVAPDETAVQTPAAPAQGVEQPVATDSNKKLDRFIKMRFNAIDAARLIKKDIEIDGKTNLEIMQEAMTDSMGDAVKDKSLEYLMGVASASIDTRTQASDYLKQINDGTSESSYLPNNILQLKTNNNTKR